MNNYNEIGTALQNFSDTLARLGITQADITVGLPINVLYAIQSDIDYEFNTGESMLEAVIKYTTNSPKHKILIKRSKTEKLESLRKRHEVALTEVADLEKRIKILEDE